MGIFGSGDKNSTTQNLTQTETSQSTVSENEGVAVAGGSNNVITYTDYNAIGRATDLAQSTLDASNDISRNALALSLQTSQLSADFAGGAVTDVTNFARNFGDSVFSTVEKALGSVSGAYQDSAAFQNDGLNSVTYAQGDALAAVQETNAGALDTVSNVFKSAFQGITDFVGNLQERAQNQLGDTVTALNEIATENSKSTDQRVAEISGNAIRYVVIGLAVLVIGGGLFAAIATRRHS